MDFKQQAADQAVQHTSTFVGSKLATGMTYGGGGGTLGIGRDGFGNHPLAGIGDEGAAPWLCADQPQRAELGQRGRNRCGTCVILTGECSDSRQLGTRGQGGDTAEEGG